MPSFKYLALAALLALSGTSATWTNRDSNAADERINALDRISMSFDVVSDFLDSVEVNDESIEKMEMVNDTMAEMEPVLTQMRDTMFEESADEMEWSVYSSTLEKFRSVMGALDGKLREIPSQVFDESSDEEVDGEALLEALKYVNGAVEDDTNDEDDLREAEEVLDFVRGHLNGFEGETKIKFEEAIEYLGEKLDEKTSSFEVAVESEDENENEEELLKALSHVRTVVNDAKNKDDLREAEEVLDFVDGNLNVLDGEVKSKFEEVTEILHEEVDERKFGFEEEKLAGLISKLGFDEETIENYLNEDEEH
jgi:hypothetical protein